MLFFGLIFGGDQTSGSFFGFFKSSGVCYSCALKNIGCKKCSNSDENNFKCEECFDGYELNNNLCELIKYPEYPEITLGCLISDDMLEDYKRKYKNK